MTNRPYTGTEFIEHFFLFAGLLWLFGALAFISVAMLGAGGIGVTPASNQTPVADSPLTQ